MKINKFLKISILVATICYAKSGQNLENVGDENITGTFSNPSTIKSTQQGAMITTGEYVTFLTDSINNVFSIKADKSVFKDGAFSSEKKADTLQINNATFEGSVYANTLTVGNLDNHELADDTKFAFDKTLHISKEATFVNITDVIRSNIYGDNNTNIELIKTNVSGTIRTTNLNLTESSTASNVEESVIANISDGSTITATSSTFESGSINTTGTINTTNSTYKIGATNSTTKAIIEDNGSTFNGEIFANELSLTNSDLTNVSSISAETLTAKDIKNKNALLVDKITTTDATFDAKSKMIMNFNVDTQTLQATNTIFTSKVNSKIITSSNSTFARRFSTDNLTADNSNFILGGSDDTYTGAIISKTSTNGANNTISLLGIVSSGKLQKDKITNLPLAVLKKGTADINTFITRYQALEGIDLYELNPKYMSKKEINGYLVYALDKSGANTDISSINFKDNNKIAEDNITDIANKTNGGTGSFVNYINGVDKEINATLIEKLASADIVSKNTQAPEETSQATPNSGNNTNNGNENNTQNPPTENNIVPNNAENTNDIAQNTSNTNKPNNENPKELAMPNLNKQEAQAVAIVDDLIQQVTINKKAVAEVKSLGSSISFSHIFEWNNLNKRMGDLRNLQNDYGVWARFEMTKAELNGYKLSQNEVQAGADKKINLNNGEYFTGFMINASNAEDENKTSKSTNLGFGIYSSMFFDNGYFIDALIRASNYSTKFNHDMFLDELKSNKIGALGSIEFGKRFDECDFYVEPSASLIVAYEPKMNLRSKIADITSDNKLRFHTKASVFGGYHLNEQTTIRMGLGYAMDLNKSSDILLKSNLSQKEEIISGDKYKRGFANIGTNVYFDKNTRLNFEYERSFGGDLKINHQINATLRYSF